MGKCSGTIVDKCHEVAMLFCPPITELMLTPQSNKTSANADRQMSLWPKGHTHTDGYTWMYKHQKKVHRQNNPGSTSSIRTVLTI